MARSASAAILKLRNLTLRMNADLSRRGFVLGAGAAIASLGLGNLPAQAQSAPPKGVLFENVRLLRRHHRQAFWGDQRAGGGQPDQIDLDDANFRAGQCRADARVQGAGRTLMPGLIDAHTHIMFATVPRKPPC